MSTNISNILLKPSELVATTPSLTRVHLVHKRAFEDEFYQKCFESLHVQCQLDHP